MMRNIVNLLLILILTIVVNGCGYKRAYITPKVDNLPVLDSKQTKTNLVYDFTWVHDMGLGRPRHTSDNFKSTLSLKRQDEFEDTLKNSGYFNEIVESHLAIQKGIKRDIYVKTTYQMTEPSVLALFPAMLGACTLALLPTWSTYTFEVECRVQTASGDMKIYNMKDEVRMYIWLPLLFAGNFDIDPHGPTRQNLYKNVLLKIYEDGLID